jgi:hypothetical protein
MSELKLKIVPVRFNSENLARLDALRGTTPRAVWLHAAGLQQPPTPPAPVFPTVNREIWAYLRMGPMSNLHQLVHRVNSLETEMPGAGLRELAGRLEELIALSHQLRDGLLSVVVGGGE